MHRTTRISNIKKLSRTPEKFMQEIADNKEDYAGNLYALKDLLRYCGPQSLNHETFKQFVSIAVVNELQTNLPNPRRNAWGSVVKFNGEYRQLIDLARPALLSGAKRAVVDIILNTHQNFYNHVRKHIVRTCCAMLEENDPRARNLFVEFYRVLDDVSAKLLLSKITNPEKDAEVNKILNESKYFIHLKFDDESVLSDLELRKELIRQLASSPTICKKIPFKVTVTKEDIENLPPVTRFDFLRYLFKYKISASHSTYSYSHRLSMMERGRQVDMLPLPLEDVKELLFPISLHKNTRMVNWIKKYEGFLNRIGSMNK